MLLTPDVMGIDDRDYMKDSKGKSNSSSQDEVVNLNEILFIFLKLAVLLFILILGLRFPVLWIKIPVALLVLFLGWRWIFKGKKKKNNQSAPSTTNAKREQTRERRNQMTAIERYKAAASKSPKPDQNSVRLLVAYDAAGEFGKAKSLIQCLDGEVFSESVAYELAVLAGNYFPVELEPTETGFRFKLVSTA